MRRRAYEWSANTFQASCDDSVLQWLEWGESNANGGVYPKASPGSVNPDIAVHRVLVDFEMQVVAAGGGAPPDTSLQNNTLTVGILETEFDAPGANPILYDPSYSTSAPNQDAEWLWMYTWQLDDSLANKTAVILPLSHLKPNLRYHHDIRIRRRAGGASVNMKRRDLVWVLSSDCPAASVACVVNVAYRVLLSVPK